MGESMSVRARLSCVGTLRVFVAQMVEFVDPRGVSCLIDDLEAGLGKSRGKGLGFEFSSVGVLVAPQEQHRHVGSPQFLVGEQHLGVLTSK